MLNTTTILGILGALSLVVNIMVEILKKFLPKKVPTQLVAIIVSLITCIAFIFVFCEIGIKTIIIGIFMSPVVAYISMNGFDTFSKLWLRFQPKEIEEEKEDDE